MVDKTQNSELKPESSSAPSQLSSAGSSLDLLIEGRTLDLHQPNDSAAPFLAPVAIDMGTQKVADTAKVPTDTAPGYPIPGTVEGFGSKPGMTIPSSREQSEQPMESHEKIEPGTFIPPVSTEPKVDANPKPSPTYPPVNAKPEPRELTLPNFAVSINPIEASEIREATDSIFSRIDGNNNGFLNKEELAKAIEDGSFKGQEAQVINALYQNVDMLSNLSINGRYDQGLGISRKDMAAFDSLVEANEHEKDLFGNAYAWSDKRFGSFDTDKSNSLSWDEIGKGLEEKHLDASDGKMLHYLKDNFGEVGAAHDDKEWFLQTKEITRGDLSDQMLNLELFNNASRTISNLEGWIGRTSRAQQPEISRSLFANQNNPELSVTPEAIKQGYTEDGSFLASVAALAKSDPKAIVDMIKTNPDGTYTVTFPGDKSHPVTVKAPTDAELGMYNGGSPSGTWASVLEKSYGLYLKTYQGKGGLTDIEAASQGGQPIDALKTLTGRDDFKWEDLSSFSKESITELLKNNFENPNSKPIVVSTASNLFDVIMQGESTENGFPRNRNFTVTGIESDGQGDYMVTVQNPWGSGKYSTWGTISISIEQFQKNFHDIVY